MSKFNTKKNKDDIENSFNFQNDYFSSILEQLQIGVVILDFNDKIIYANKSFCNMLGYDLNELVGKSNFDTIYFDEDKEIMKTRNIFRRKGIKELYETNLKHKNNNCINVLVNANPFKNKQDEIEGFMAACVDITDKKREDTINKNLFRELVESTLLSEHNLQQKTDLIEELMHSKIELQLASTEKERFFSIIIHDIKNAFSGFINYIKFFSDEIEYHKIAELGEYTNQMLSSAESLFKLLENLLEWSKIKQKVIIFNPTHHNIKLIINQIINILNINAINKKITLQTNIDNNLEAYVDPKMFNTIIRNLVHNAIKFSKEGKNITIGYQDDETYDVFYVQDQGIGIPPEILDNLFVFDHRKLREGTSGEPTSGLGLLLCKEFVELHNGKIYATSKENNGTTIYLAFPKVKKEIHN